MHLSPGLQRSRLRVVLQDLIDADTTFVRLMVFPTPAERNPFRYSEILAVACQPRAIGPCRGPPSPTRVAVLRDTGYSSTELFLKVKRQLMQLKTTLCDLTGRWASCRADIKSMFGNHNVHSFGRVVRVSGCTTVAPSWSNSTASIVQSIFCNDLLIYVELTGRYISAIQKKISGSYVNQSGQVIDSSSAAADTMISIDWIRSSVELVTGYLDIQQQVMKGLCCLL